MNKYRIKPKRDFGQYGYRIDGETVRSGFVVTDGGICNVMPGATWFRTVGEAMDALDVLMNTRTADEFWQVLRERRSPRSSRAIRALR